MEDPSLAQMRGKNPLPSPSIAGELREGGEVWGYTINIEHTGEAGRRQSRVYNNENSPASGVPLQLARAHASSPNA